MADDQAVRILHERLRGIIDMFEAGAADHAISARHFIETGQPDLAAEWARSAASYALDADAVKKCMGRR